MKVNHDTRGNISFRRRPDVLVASAGDRLVILAPPGKRYWGLGDVGLRIWDLMEEPRTVHQIAGILAGEYALPMDTILKDVDEFLDQLLRAQLVEVTVR